MEDTIHTSSFPSGGLVVEPGSTIVGEQRGLPFDDGVRIPHLKPTGWEAATAAIEDDGFITVYPNLNSRAAEIHNNNIQAGWWTDLKTGQSLRGVDEHGRHRRNVGELLMLCITEVTEAATGYAGDLMDDKLPHRPMLEVELADTEIRLLDTAGAHFLDISGACHDLIHVAGFKAERWRSVSSGLLSIVMEIGRAFESYRRGQKADEMLPMRSGFECGIAAAVLRIRALGEAQGLDVAEAIEEKRSYNRTREDHRVENRLLDGGKLV